MKRRQHRTGGTLVALCFLLSLIYETESMFWMLREWGTESSDERHTPSIPPLPVALSDIRTCFHQSLSYTKSLTMA
jgi:hypothetical protein